MSYVSNYKPDVAGSTVQPPSPKVRMESVASSNQAAHTGGPCCREDVLMLCTTQTMFVWVHRFSVLISVS